MLDIVAALLVALALWKMVVRPNLVRPPAGPAPPVRLALLDGSRLAVPQPGRVLFLDFWATWCLPCRASLPLVEAYARAHPEVDVVAVNVGDKPEAIAAFAKEHALSRVAIDGAPVAEAYGVSGFPTIVIVDANGRLRDTWEGLNPAVGLAMERARRAYSTARRP